VNKRPLAKLELLVAADCFDFVIDGLVVTVGKYCERDSLITAARRAKVCVSKRDVLIGNVYLFFENIQLWVIEDLPPIAADYIVLRVREFPVVGLLESFRGDFFVTRRRCHGGLRILGRFVAALEQNDAQERNRQI